jgi:6-pyruvoyltetrahydropterin/6-carboxytetrahydropterin synthase
LIYILNQKEFSSSVAVDRVSAHFSASHALISDHFEEGLHGHNYQVEIEVEGNTENDDVIIDFIFLENLLNQALSSWDHYVLLPSKNKRMKIRKTEDNVEIEYGSRFYSFPKTETRFLDCRNVTTESLARLIAEKMTGLLKQESFWRRIQSIKATIWETSAYRASYTIKANSARM